MAGKRVFITGTDRDGNTVTFAVDAIISHRQGTIPRTRNFAEEGGQPILNVHLQSNGFYQFRCAEATRVLRAIEEAI